MRSEHVLSEAYRSNTIETRRKIITDRTERTMVVGVVCTTILFILLLIASFTGYYLNKQASNSKKIRQRLENGICLEEY